MYEFCKWCGMPRKSLYSQTALWACGTKHTRAGSLIQSEPCAEIERLNKIVFELQIALESTNG